MLALGFFLGYTVHRYDAPRGAMLVYAVIGTLILAARWAVVRRRERREGVTAR
jgi:hypothetical protein